MLEIRDVTRSFGALKALDQVSFQVPGGRLTGFVGANGAGKTTAMRILMGVLSMDSGEVLFDGQPVSRAAQADFGYMPEERGLYPKMGVREQLVYFAQLHGLSAAKAGANTDRLLSQLGLTARANDKVEKLSLGNQQRAQIAAALVHDPSVLILDEPFSGLDPLAVETVMGVLREFAAKGAPILFSSHQLDVVERITDDLIIIAAGQIKAEGATSALRERYAGSRYHLVLPGSDAASATWVETVPGVTNVTTAAPDLAELEPAAAVDVAFDASAEVAQKVLAACLERGPVEGFGRLIPPLSEVFKEVVA
ncbi:MAG: ATP-binding cassette domain-containing protein [Bifidobacteriaceae bacterium]|jgi:ABC-2 type transport system ATP-binding protein|nr:ATP-binding cassette domain-containing protein [Bifidobacteriaceae bacterium]